MNEMYLSYERALQRERSKRIQAEQALENRSRELYYANEQLRVSITQLRTVNIELIKKQNELIKMLKAHSAVTTDLQLAADLQMSIIPARGRFGGVHAAGILVPAMYVAGDAYDYFMLSENVLAFYMSDVTGHGTSSAMVAYAIHCTLNPKSGGLCHQSLEQSSSLENAMISTMKKINGEFLHGVHQNQFFTMVYGLLDIKTGELVLCQAGHPPPVLLGNSHGSVTQFGKGGFPVGLFEDADYEACVTSLKPGDKLFVYSDGLTDLRNNQGQEFGSTRLLSLFDASRDLDIDETIQSIDYAILEWKQGMDMDDDISVMILYRDATANELLQETVKAPDIRKKSIKIRNEHRNLVSVEVMLEEMLSRENADESRIGSCVICVSEAICNIIDHGYPGGTRDIISVSAQIISGTLVVEITDHAQSMPKTVAQRLCSRSINLADPSLLNLIDIPETGRGMGIMSNTASDIEYDAHIAHNRLVLRFNLG